MTKKQSWGWCSISETGNVERDSRGLNTQTAYLLEKPFLGDRYHLLVPSSIVCRVVHRFCKHKFELLVLKSSLIAMSIQFISVAATRAR